MEPANLLKAKFSALQFLQTQIGKNNADKAANWQGNLINLRRQIQDILANLREAIQSWEEKGGDPVISADLSRELSKLRSAMATHQSNWPAVVIDADNVEFQKSVHDLRSATDDFWRAANRLLDNMA